MAYFEKRLVYFICLLGVMLLVAYTFIGDFSVFWDNIYWIKDYVVAGTGWYIAYRSSGGVIKIVSKWILVYYTLALVLNIIKTSFGVDILIYYKILLALMVLILSLNIRYVCNK